MQTVTLIYKSQTANCNSHLQISNCKLQTAILIYKLQIINCNSHLQISNCKLQTAILNYKSQIANCKLQFSTIIILYTKYNLNFLCLFLFIYLFVCLFNLFIFQLLFSDSYSLLSCKQVLILSFLTLIFFLLVK